jgi:hypothetical protein
MDSACAAPGEMNAVPEAIWPLRVGGDFGTIHTVNQLHTL